MDRIGWYDPKYAESKELMFLGKDRTGKAIYKDDRKPHEFYKEKLFTPKY